MDNEIMYTSNVETIFKLFLEKKIYISNSSWMNILPEKFDENLRVGSVNITKDSIDLDSDNGDHGISAHYTYKDDSSQVRIARDIVVCYKENYDKAILLYGANDTNFLAFNMSSSNGLTQNMLLYFINTYGFITDDVDVEEFRNRVLKQISIYGSPENDILLVCGFPVESDPQEDEDGYEGNIYIHFDEDGKITSHSTSLSIEHGYLTIKLTKIDEEEEQKEDISDDDAYSKLTLEEMIDDYSKSLDILQKKLELIKKKFKEYNKEEN